MTRLVLLKIPSSPLWGCRAGVSYLVENMSLELILYSIDP